MNEPLTSSPDGATPAQAVLERDADGSVRSSSPLLSPYLPTTPSGWGRGCEYSRVYIPPPFDHNSLYVMYCMLLTMSPEGQREPSPHGIFNSWPYTRPFLPQHPCTYVRSSAFFRLIVGKINNTIPSYPAQNTRFRILHTCTKIFQISDFRFQISDFSTVYGAQHFSW